MDLKWNDLAQHVQNRTVEIVLPDAVTIRSNITAANTDSLDIDITKTPDSRAHPKGRASIERASVKTLMFRETSGKWRGLGKAIGAGGGGAAGGLMSIPIHNEGDSARAGVITAAAVGGGAAMGYFLGRSAAFRHQALPSG